MKKIARAFLLFSALTLFSFVRSAHAQIPSLVYSDSSTSNSESGNGFRIQYGGTLGTGSLTGNLITLRLTAPHGSTISSITDNQSDSYTLAASADSGSGGFVTALYYLANAPAGIRQITVTYSASVAQWHYSLQEYSGVAINSPLDGTCSNNTTTVACSSAITTTGSNNLIVATTIASGNSSIYQNPLSAIAPGGNFVLDSADTQSSDADEESVQASAGSVTPSFTVTGNSQKFNVVGAAFKSSPGAGTNPTGMNIRHIQHVQVNNGGSQPAYFISTGNLLVVSFELGPTFATYSIGSCSPSNTFTKRTIGTFWPQFFYLPASGSFSTNLKCTVTGGNGANAHFVIYDIAGAAANPEDTNSPLGGQGNGGTVTDTLTPTNKPGIIIAAANDGTGPVTSFSSSSGSAIFDNTPYTAETDLGQLNNGDSWGHVFYNTTSPITLTWTMQNPSSYMQASSIAFDAATSATPPNQPTGLKATVQ